MNRTILGYLTLSLAIGFPSIGAAEKERTLFIAFAMTKAQEASAIPTDSGSYLRSEKQDSWHRIGPVIQSMSGLAVDPSAPATMFMACGNGIVRSKDGGENWRMVTGWRESDFLKIAIEINLFWFRSIYKLPDIFSIVSFRFSFRPVIIFFVFKF